MQAGTRIADRYVVEELLGEGGMGQVLRARDETLGRTVALKLVSPKRVGSADAAARMLREARAAAQLEHPAIVRVYDAGTTEDGSVFVVMELVRGRSLREVLQGEGRMEPPAVASVLDAVGAALAAAHERGLVHRDVKPDNVLLADDGRALLCDFGLAKQSSVDPTSDTVSADQLDPALTKTGVVVGTPAYLSPEQARGVASPSSDQWALAATAFELLTGRPPWVADDATHLLAQILVDDPPSAHALRPELPEAIDAVLRRGLEKKASARYASVSELVAAVREALGLAPTSSTSGDALARGAARAPSTTSSTAIPSSADKPEHTASAQPTPSRAPLYAGIGLVVFGLASAGVAASLGVFGGGDPSRGGLDAEPAPTPPLDPTSTVACPLLAPAGDAPDTQWLGAVAADQLCAYVRPLLGGGVARVWPPAELLDLPRQPADDYPDPTFEDPGTHEWSLARAPEATAWLDGSIEDAGDAFVLRVSLRRGPLEGGTSGEAVEARATSVHEAALAVVRELSQRGELPPFDTALDATVARGSGLATARDMILLERLEMATSTGLGVEAACAERPRAEEPALARVIDAACTREGLATAWTGMPLAQMRQLESPSDRRAELAAARAETEDADERAWALRAEAMVAEAQGQDDASAVLRAAVAAMPSDCVLRDSLVNEHLGSAALVGVLASGLAWCPRRAEAWRSASFVGTDEDRVLLLERARRLAGHGLYAVSLAQILIDIGHCDAARNVAAELHVGPPEQALASIFVQAMVDMREARFERAYEALRDAMASHEGVFDFVDGDVEAMGALLTVSSLLGRERDTAEALLRRFVLDLPEESEGGPLLHMELVNAEAPLLLACALASRDTCSAALPRLRLARERSAPLDARMRGVHEALEARMRGDHEAAVAAWRRVALSGMEVSFLVALAPIAHGDFVRAGDYAHAEALETNWRFDAIAFHGASPFSMERMRRCAAQRDRTCVSETAERAMEAWSTADAELAAVDKLRAFLRR